MRIGLSVAALLILTSAALAQTPLPVDENGEEVFGPGYMPRRTQIPSLPLYMAQPNAGLEIPA